MKPPIFVNDSPLKQLKKISSFSPESVVKQYVMNRKIPTEYHYKLFFCKEFKKWVNSFISDKFDTESLTREEPRLIIPFLDKENKLFGFQGRSFKKTTALRYITIMLDEDKPKLYGLDTVDINKDIYVVEGPIDSMFLPNAIASAGSDITSNLNYVTEDMSKFIIVYDNEPRNKDINKKIARAIDSGYRVCIWPNSLELKDINDMHMAGMSIQKIVDLIQQNTYNGLEAKLKFAMWKKS